MLIVGVMVGLIVYDSEEKKLVPTFINALAVINCDEKLTGSPVGLSVGFKVGLIVYWYEIQERLVGTYRSSLGSIHQLFRNLLAVQLD